MSYDTQIDLIEAHLNAIIEEGGDGNFVIFNFTPDYFIQFAAGKGDKSVLGECVSNNFLAEGKKLNPVQQDILNRLGWTAPGGPKENYSQNLEMGSPEGLRTVADLVSKTAMMAFSVYEIKPDMIELILE